MPTWLSVVVLFVRVHSTGRRTLVTQTALPRFWIRADSAHWYTLLRLPANDPPDHIYSDGRGPQQQCSVIGDGHRPNTPLPSLRPTHRRRQ